MSVLGFSPEPSWTPRRSRSNSPVPEDMLLAAACRVTATAGLHPSDTHNHGSSTSRGSSPCASLLLLPPRGPSAGPDSRPHSRSSSNMAVASPVDLATAGCSGRSSFTWGATAAAEGECPMGFSPQRLSMVSATAVPPKGIDPYVSDQAVAHMCSSHTSEKAKLLSYLEQHSASMERMLSGGASSPGPRTSSLPSHSPSYIGEPGGMSSSSSRDVPSQQQEAVAAPKAADARSSSVAAYLQGVEMLEAAVFEGMPYMDQAVARRSIAGNSNMLQPGHAQIQQMGGAEAAVGGWDGGRQVGNHQQQQQQQRSSCSSSQTFECQEWQQQQQQLAQQQVQVSSTSVSGGGGKGMDRHSIVHQVINNRLSSIAGKQAERDGIFPFGSPSLHRLLS